jgi:hypothetical protein
LPLDLAAAFHAAYDLSIRPGSIHYEETPPEPAVVDWTALTKSCIIAE